jgi:hypothetical protein
LVLDEDEEDEEEGRYAHEGRGVRDLAVFWVKIGKRRREIVCVQLVRLNWAGDGDGGRENARFLLQGFLWVVRRLERSLGRKFGREELRRGGRRSRGRCRGGGC